ncbi:MAG: MFS transporter [Anaerolineae bacterium]|nr:MAG: MFS transporter [Anaerolineae bacterium]
MSLFSDRPFRAAAAGHFAVDLINGQRALILAALSGPLGLSNVLIGVLSAAYTLLGSVLQPVFGLLADRIGARWVATLGILWMALSFGAAVLIPGRVALLLLVLTAMGSAAFHPAGTAEATDRARRHLASRVVFAASLFFLFGQIGFAVGPALGGMIVELRGVPGLMLLLLLVLPVGIYAGLRIPTGGRHSASVSDALSTAGDWRGFVPFAILIALRSWAMMTMVAFIPKYYSDLGYSPGVFGIIAALYMGGSALGGIGGGWLADRTDKRALVSRTLIVAGIPLLLMVTLGASAWGYLLVFLAGGLIGISHSPIVVHAQGMVPTYVGAASGAVLGFTFASGSIGILVSGFLADQFGFGVVFAVAAAMVTLGGLLAGTARSWLPAAETV